MSVWLALLWVLGFGCLSNAAPNSPPPPDKPPASSAAPAADLLPAPSVSSQNKEVVGSLSLVTLEAGNRISISLKDAIAKLSAVTEWTIYIVDTDADEIKWSKSGKGKPPEAIEWDGLLDNGVYPESGKTYSFKAVIQSGGASRKTKSKDLTVSLLNSDLIEIGEVAQRASLGLCSVKSTTGSLPSIPCAGGATRVLLGQLVVIDGWMVKEFKSLNPEPKLDGRASKGTLTMAQLALSLRYKLNAIDLQLGGAFSYDRLTFKQIVAEEAKSNPPAETPPAELQDAEGPDAEAAEEDGEEGRTVDADLQSSAIRLASQYTGSKMLIAAEATLGFSKAARHTGFGVSADYVLTPSWFVGAEAHAVQIGAAKSGNPGLSFASVLMHIGFDVKRTGGNR